MKEPLVLICAALLGGAFLLASLADDIPRPAATQSGCAQCAIKAHATVMVER